MGMLLKKIEEADLPQVYALLKRVFDDGTYRDISRLGGMTNHSYKIVRNDGAEYLVRIPGEGTKEMINRTDEKKSTELACRLGIDTELLYFGDDGTKIMRFIHNPQEMSDVVMRKEENIRQAADIFHRLHTCGENTGVRFEVFEMASLYEHLIRETQVALYDDYETVKQTVMNVKRAIDETGNHPHVPCHNDSLMGNWVLDGTGKLWLIDWEYSGMNDAMWDLSCLSIEADYTEKEDALLLEMYFGSAPSADQQKRFIAAKIYVDYLWTLWGLTRVPFDGDYMQEYADMRYERLKRSIALM